MRSVGRLELLLLLVPVGALQVLCGPSLFMLCASFISDPFWLAFNFVLVSRELLEITILGNLPIIESSSQGPQIHLNLNTYNKIDGINQ